MQALEYYEACYSKIIWQYIENILCCDEFLQEKMQGKVANLILNCLKSYANKKNRGEKDYFERLYNCNEALFVYVRELHKKGITEVKDVSDCIEFAKSINNLEIQSKWS